MSNGGAIVQSKSVTPGHALSWVADGVAQDAGPATAGNLSELGITREGGVAFGINNAVVPGPYVEFGVGVANTGTITLYANSFGGAPSAILEYNINGSTYPFNPSVTGNVVGPSSATAGNLASFNGTSGQIIQDAGVTAAGLVQGPTVAVANNIVLFSGTTGRVIKDSGIGITVQLGDMKYSALGIEGNGWRLCNGQTRPQSDPFWVYMVANGLTASWRPGFTSTSTYNMPNAQDVVLVGLDKMGGATSPGLLTAAVAGFDPTILLNTGGSQHAQQDTINITVTGSITATDSGHDHTTSGIVSNGNFAAGGAAPYPGGSANTGTAAANIAVTNTQTITAASSLVGTSQNIQPSMMAAVLMWVNA